MFSNRLVAAVASVALIGPVVVARGAEPGAAPVTQPQMDRSVMATVNAVRGMVQVRDDETSPWRFARVGMSLPVGGEVRTAPHAAISVIIPPAQVVTVDRLTTIKILEAAKTSSKFVTDLGMKYGRVRYDVEAGGAEHEAIIRAPSSALAVRGTSVEMTDDAFGSSILLCRGHVEATIADQKVDLRRPDAETPSPSPTPPTPAPASRPAVSFERISSATSLRCIRITDKNPSVVGLDFLSTASPMSLSHALSEEEFDPIAFINPISSSATGVAGRPARAGSGSSLGGPNIDTIGFPTDQSVAGNLAFTLTWTGDNSTGAGIPNLDLIVVAPDGTRYLPSDSGPQTINGVAVSGNDRGGTASTVGTEQVKWLQSYLSGNYKYSVRYVGSGQPGTYTVQVAIDGKVISPPFIDTLTQLDPRVDLSISVAAQQAARNRARAAAAARRAAAAVRAR